MKVSLKLGGHVLFDEGGSLVRGLAIRYAELLRRLWGEGHVVHVVVGGGPPARALIASARAVGCPEPICDEVGIEVSRINARILASMLHGLAHQPIPRTYEELRWALSTGRMVVCGGLQPGQSTTAVAAILAELMGADLMVVATDVDGVYTEDPRRSPSARRIPEMSYGELRELISRLSSEAGGFKLFDHVALGVIERSRITCRVVDGRDPDNVARAVRGEEVGTRIGP